MKGDTTAIMSKKSIELKILEWNINGRAGYGNYSIPIFVADEIISQDADIVILTEFVVSMGWDYFKGVLEKKYKIFSSPYISGQNGVLIAIKKDTNNIDYDSIVATIEMNTKKTEKPNFLQLELEISKVPLIIIGTRILVDDGSDKDLAERKEQRQAIYDHLNYFSSVCRVVCMGDFNATPRFLWSEVQLNCKNFELDCPSYNTDDDTYKRINREYCSWSYVHENGQGVDKGKTSIDNTLSSRIKVANSDYKWNFMSKNNGYGELGKEDFKSHLIGLPDHAILTATIEIL